MEKHTIGGLKKILISAENFGDIQDYFFSLSETNHQAILGKLGKNKSLKDIVATTLSHLLLVKNESLDTKIVLINFRMIEVKERYFWHGSGILPSGDFFVFFYFADLDKGLVALSNPKTSMTYYARMSIKSAKEKENPMDAFSQN